MMVRTLFFLFSILCINTSFAQGFKLTLNAPQYKEGITYLIYYYGKNMNVEDSVAINSNGVAVFQKKEKVKPGVYSIVFPGKSKLYDFLIDKDSDIKINVPDTARLMENTVVTGAKENPLFQEYQAAAGKTGMQMQREIEAYRASTNKADSQKHEKLYQALNTQLNQYREKIISEHGGSMLASLLTSMKEPTVLHPRPITRQDSMENYQYYKAHYWDGITFMDDRIIRTPFFLPKLERYFREIVSPAPDSTIKDMEYILLLSRSNPEMNKFLLNWFTDEYYSPKYMGQDKVFVHLFEKYHSKGVSNWLNEKQLKSISDRAYMVMSNLIGEPAANIEMTTEAGKKVPLYSVAADYTVVVFWDPTCGHCRTELPKMDTLYNQKWKKEGVKIYAVLTENKEKEKWLAFIKDNKLSDWTHVYETDAQKKAIEAAQSPSYKQLFDVTQTPTLYLLDKNKRIIAKKLTLEQMDEVLDAKIKSDGK